MLSVRPQKGAGHTFYLVQVCIRGRKGDGDAAMSLLIIVGNVPPGKLENIDFWKWSFLIVNVENKIHELVNQIKLILNFNITTELLQKEKIEKTEFGEFSLYN